MTDVVERIDQLECDLIRQEHRIAHVFYNVWLFRESGDKRAAAMWALTMYFFSPSGAGAGVSLVAFCGLLVAIYGNSLISQQNQKIGSQTGLLQMQNELMQMQELTSILDQIQREKRAVDWDSKSVEQQRVAAKELRTTADEYGHIEKSMQVAKFPISIGSRARCVVLSSSLEPLAKQRSRGRGQLFLSMAYSNVDITLLTECDFTGSDCSKAMIVKALVRDLGFQNSSFKGTTFAECDFRNVNFANADLTNAKFPHSDFTACNFQSATLVNADFGLCHLPTASNFSNANLSNVNLQGAMTENQDWLLLVHQKARQFNKDRWKCEVIKDDELHHYRIVQNGD